MHKSANTPTKRGKARHPFQGPSAEARERVLADLDARGISIRGWARANGVKASAVYHLLSGKNKGRRGEAHRAAVLLGLKSGAIEDQQGESEHGGL